MPRMRLLEGVKNPMVSRKTSAGMAVVSADQKEVVKAPMCDVEGIPCCADTSAVPSGEGMSDGQMYRS